VLAAEWVRLGREAILQLLEIEHAVVWPEVEAKIADKKWEPLGLRIQPHHLTSARQQLRDEGVITTTSDTTRGGRVVPVMHLADVEGRRRKIEDALARKRLLQARYLAWAVTLHLLGPAGEQTTHSSLLKVAPVVGYRLERPEGGEVTSLFGAPVEGGALDGAAHLQLVDGSGVPTGVATVPLEVKNVREWIYPGSERLHQLLYKAAILQVAHPGVSVVPVLVCRRAPWSTFRMAKALGFYVADAKAQFLPVREDVSQEHVEEVRVELGYSDLVVGVGPDRLLVRHFGRALPSIAADAAANWAVHGPALLDLFRTLRDPTLADATRSEVAASLEAEAREILAQREADSEEGDPQVEDDPDAHWQPG
jgi:hypothetical protein